jgi:WhiB family transcriptional regulator, redox-sensing transcriptional regulator
MAYNLFDDLGRPLWQKGGACRPEPDATPEELNRNSNIFFPERGSSTKEAKSICAFCPMNQECLDYALMNGEKHGIWGGTSERERRKIRKIRTVEDPDWRKKLRDYYGLKDSQRYD